MTNTTLARAICLVCFGQVAAPAPTTPTTPPTARIRRALCMENAHGIETGYIHKLEKQVAASADPTLQDPTIQVFSDAVPDPAATTYEYATSGAEPFSIPASWNVPATGDEPLTAPGDDNTVFVDTYDPSAADPADPSADSIDTSVDPGAETVDSSAESVDSSAEDSSAESVDSSSVDESADLSPMDEFVDSSSSVDETVDWYSLDETVDSSSADESVDYSADSVDHSYDAVDTTDGTVDDSA